MALSVTQAQSIEQDPSALTVVVNITTTPGSLLVALVGQGSNTTNTVTGSDSASQTWTQYSSHATSGTSVLYIMYMPNSSGVTSVTMTFNNASTFRTLIVYEVAGADTTSPADNAASGWVGNAGNVTSLTSSTYSTAIANEIVFYGVGVNGGAMGATTPGSGFTIATNGASTYLALQYAIVSSIQTSQTTSMSWLNAHNVEGGIAAFKAPVAAFQPDEDFWRGPMPPPTDPNIILWQ